MFITFLHIGGVKFINIKSVILVAFNSGRMSIICMVGKVGFCE